MSPEKQALIDALLVERYGRNEWWTRKPDEAPEVEDNDINTAWRRKVLREAFEECKEESA